MKLLAIDTSTLSGSVALLADGEVVAEKLWHGPEGHAAALMPAISDLMRATDVAGPGLDAIVAAIGPGSFTGLRVGLATAKGLALGWGKPLVAVSSLAAMAFNVNKEATAYIVPILDARRGEIYMAAYDNGVEVVAECVRMPSECADKLAALKTNYVCFGDGFNRYRDIFVDRLGPRLVEVDKLPDYPGAVAVGCFGLEKLRRGETTDISVPNYIRRSQAEVNKGGGDAAGNKRIRSLVGRR